MLLVFFINLTMTREHLSESSSMIEKISNPVLNEPIQYIEYNRNNIPVEMRNKLSALLYQKLLLKTNKPILPVGYEFVQIKKDNEKSLWLVECFISKSRCFETHRIIWEFWMLPGGKYQLKSVRPFSLKDNNSNLVPKIYGVQKNRIITSDNITNSLKNNLEAGLNSDNQTTLEMTDIPNELRLNIDNRQGRQPIATAYNKWILPKDIYDSNAYVTFTPDIINNNLYRTGTYDDLFSRTRSSGGFPRGRSTGGR
jgi:hypothetical protein